jgi:hypothetical protein
MQFVCKCIGKAKGIKGIRAIRMADVDLVGQLKWPRDKERDRRIPQAERLPKTTKVIAPESGRRHERFSKL